MNSRHMRSACLAAVLLLFASVAAQTETTDPGPVDGFPSEMDAEIASGDVQPGTSVLPDWYPPDELRPEGIQGVTYWPDMTSAPYTWVHARGKTNQAQAWNHTTHTIHYSYYVHGRSQRQPIPLGDFYYIKGLHWIPKNTPDFPPAGSNPVPPGWAQGEVHSPTYLTGVKYDMPPNGELQIFLDVCLSGPTAMW